MSTILRLIFFLGDLLLLNLAIAVSFLVQTEPTDLSNKVYLFIFSNLAWLYLTLVSSPYNLDKAWTVSKVAKTQLAFLFIHLLVVVSLIFFLRKTYSVYQTGLIYLVFIPGFFLWRIITYYLRKIFTAELTIKNYVLIGKNETSAEVRKYYLSNADLGYRFVGYIDFDGDGEKLVQQIRDVTKNIDVHEVFCCSNELTDKALKPLIDLGLDSLIKVRVVFNTAASTTQTIQLDRYDQEIKQNRSVINLDEASNQIIKRIFDLVFSTVFILTVMSWLLPIIAIIIKFDSRGAVFFVQPRSGKFNKPFNCFKFRSMRSSIDANSKQATKNDPRITKLGAFLRKTSIDELPQFFNVFIGNMSVIGPRPHMLSHTEEYSKLIEKFMGRHYVKPGITGLAQCLGYRGETQTLADMENRVRLDRYYIENWTFWLDIKIIFLTIISLIRGSDKAY
ncbi:MAG: exopolysaccharide biosynthesis polyprenyl glycosylphosphotransferase [Cyclobacteriaceae bacterium]|nr:exopolysaccharide biosynthesis polyprenyl glycosylphosphotransferase [Cyclobacteriaceae bacterium]